MIKIVVGDLLGSSAQTLVNTVNCVGIMGKGIALQFKDNFPEMFADYAARCSRGEVKLGQPYLYRRLVPPWILNFPTKAHWRSVSRLTDIVNGLNYLKEHYIEWGIESLAVPPLGCGHGQLEWTIVGPTLYRNLRTLEIPVELFAPHGTPATQLELSFLEGSNGKESLDSGFGPPRFEPAWIALLEILRRIEAEPYHWPIGRVAFQKIAYFATEAGIPTGLQYQRGSYGPYATQLKMQIAALSNNGLIDEASIGRMLAVKVGSTFEDARLQCGPEISNWMAAVRKVSELFTRMNTGQAEVAATVHFAARELQKERQGEPTEREIVEAVMKWKQKRRPPLHAGEVAVAVRKLNMLNWISAQVSEDLLPAEEGLADGR